MNTLAWMGAVPASIGLALYSFNTLGGTLGTLIGVALAIVTLLGLAQLMDAVMDDLAGVWGRFFS